MTQSALDQFDDDGYRGDLPGERRTKLGFKMLAENAEPFNDLSCPWCCAPPSDFTCGNDRDARPACGNCSAVIPVEQDWYLRGEKIAV